MIPTISKHRSNDEQPPRIIVVHMDLISINYKIYGRVHSESLLSIINYNKCLLFC